MTIAFFVFIGLRLLAAKGEVTEPRAISANAPPGTASTVFQKTKPYVCALKTAVSENAPKASYGSAFVVDKTGLLATNYHVVVDAVRTPKKYKTFVIIDGKPIRAKVVAIDVVRDLALVHVSHEFSGALEFGGVSLETGAKLYSVGVPEDLNMSIVEGNYNGLQKNGPYENVVLSSPINPGMSGGPTINEQAQIVGVNVAILRQAQNISFAVPASYLKKLVDETRLPDRAVAAVVDDWGPSIVRQLKTAADELSEAWMQKASERVEFKGWRAHAPPAGLKCWRDQKEKYAREANVDVQRCMSLFSASPERDIQSGNYEIAYMNVTSPRLKSFQFFHLLDDIYGDLATSSFESNGLIDELVDSLLDESSEARYTKPRCGEEIVVNKQNIAMKVNYCVTGLVRYEGLLNGFVRWVTLEKQNSALLMVLKLKGFRSQNMKQLFEALTHSVEKF
ncbi:MAG: serine protease [Bdellovibrionota bacterium]